MSLDIINTGKLNGAEVVQLYVQDVKSSVLRPEKELKAFQKVQVLAGETKTVNLAIAASDLAFYDETIGNWKLEAGKFKLMIGTSSRIIHQTFSVEIKE